MPSAPHLVGQPSVPKEPRHADLGASRQLSARLPTPTARLRPRCRRIPILPRARPPIAQNFSFGERLCRPRSPDARAKGLRFRRFPTSSRFAIGSPFPDFLAPVKNRSPSEKFCRKGERTTEPPSAHAQPPARGILSKSGRIPSKEGAERSRNPDAAERSGELRLDKHRRATKRPFAAEPQSAPRLRPRPPSNDPPDFWRRGGQKGRSRALGQRFARMPP